MPKLTGLYNEYGYAVFRDGRAIYAAGNSPYTSQNYIGSRLIFGGSTVSKGIIPEGVEVLEVRAIAKFCETTLTEMCDRPDLWGLDITEGDEYELGSIKFSRDLNPLEEAYNSGALIK